MSICVSIVTYNSRGIIAEALDCLRFLSTERWRGSRIVVVDNISTDDTVEVLRDYAGQHPNLPLDIVISDRNGGWGAGNNLALAQAGDADYFLLFNPDCCIDEGSLATLVDFMDGSDEWTAGALPIIRNPEGKLVSVRPDKGRVSMFVWDLFTKALLDDRTDRRYGDLPVPVATGDDVYASGACLLLRTSVVKRMGGFDERLFVYSDDIDFSNRVTRSGYSTWLVPGTTATHKVGAGSLIDGEDAQATRRLTMFYTSELIYASKRFGPTYSAALAVWRHGPGLPLVNVRRRLRGHPPLDLQVLRQPIKRHLRTYLRHREELPSRWEPGGRP